MAESPYQIIVYTSWKNVPAKTREILPTLVISGAIAEVAGYFEDWINDVRPTEPRYELTIAVAYYGPARKVVGWSTVQHEKSKRRKQEAETHVYVDKQYRKKGIGKKLAHKAFTKHKRLYKDDGFWNGDLRCYATDSYLAGIFPVEAEPHFSAAPYTKAREQRIEFEKQQRKRKK